MLLWPANSAFTTPLSQLKGVGPKTSAVLAAEGFHTTGDLLALSPRFYQDRRLPLPIARLEHEQEALVEAMIVSAKAKWSPRTRRRFMEAVVEDEFGDRLTLCWFNFAVWMPKSLAKGRRIKIFGKVRQTARRLEMAHPDIDFISCGADGEKEASSEGLKPVYPPIGELSSGQVKKLMAQALELLPSCPRIFPEKWLQEKQLTDPSLALATLHAPPENFSGPPPRPSHCRAFRQLALFELLFWRLMMLTAREGSSQEPPRRGLAQGRAVLKAYWKSLPFKPSPEQKRVADELLTDLSSSARPMSRLLQGEVGGGKTAVAGAALFFALGRGGQAAIMAPTEVLARQHYEFLKKSADLLGFETVLLTGSLSEREKRAARAALADGQARLAIGSQALVSTATVFKDLTLAVIDEQHRFGVRQRLALRRKNSQVDLLAMSATPIPRSLALMLYGDLDSSSLKGLLPGRSPAETTLFQCEEKGLAYRHFLELVQSSGGQGFVVSPRIESTDDGDESPLPSLEEIYRDLAALAAVEGLSIDSLHGQQEAARKEKSMEDFRQGKTRILVATSIIEVGVDVPAARVILIIGAERFGLAQLHQLRGRVGRGGEDGYCLLLPTKLNANGERRLATLVNEHNGQALAELDLEMRGPGEQLGLRQSGWPPMLYARLPQDLPLLARAHELAEELWKKRKRGDDSILSKLDFSGLEDRLTSELD